METTTNVTPKRGMIFRHAKSTCTSRRRDADGVLWEFATDLCIVTATRGERVFYSWWTPGDPTTGIKGAWYTDSGITGEWIAPADVPAEPLSIRPVASLPETAVVKANGANLGPAYDAPKSATFVPAARS